MLKFLHFLFIAVVTFLDFPPPGEAVGDEDAPEPRVSNEAARDEMRKRHYGNYPDHCVACGRVPDIAALPVMCHCERCSGKDGVFPIFCLLCLRQRLNEHIHLDMYGLPVRSIDIVCPFEENVLTQAEISAARTRGKYYHIFRHGDSVYEYLSHIGGQDVTCPLGCDVTYARGDSTHVMKCPRSEHTFYQCDDCFNTVQVMERDQHQEDHQNGLYN